MKKALLHRWYENTLHDQAENWLKKQRAKKSAWGDLSPWWFFLHEWPQEIDTWIQNFVARNYIFSPMKRCDFKDEAVILWNCPDRLILFLLHQLIKPLFKHMLSSRCFSALSISGVKDAIHTLKSAFKCQNFRYIIRLDIRSYYASIDHKILLKQLNAFFQDERLRNYLQAIITIPIDKNAVLYSPKKGIPRRSSLSPFFGNLYLTPLDRAFENRKGICYIRYMDDVVILIQKKSQFLRAKARLKKVLASLQLELSPHKTKMGPLKHFHFLGVDFTASEKIREPEKDFIKGYRYPIEHESVPLLQNKNKKQAQKTCTDLMRSSSFDALHRLDVPHCQQKEKSDASTAATQISAETKIQVSMRLHPRSCRRALDKASAMDESAVHPAYIQHYLSRWATWWKRATESTCSIQSNLIDWVERAKLLHNKLEWLGRGLIDLRLSSGFHNPCWCT